MSKDLNKVRSRFVCFFFFFGYKEDQDVVFKQVFIECLLHFKVPHGALETIKWNI